MKHHTFTIGPIEATGRNATAARENAIEAASAALDKLAPPTVLIGRAGTAVLWCDAHGWQYTIRDHTIGGPGDLSRGFSGYIGREPRPYAEACMRTHFAQWESIPGSYSAEEWLSIPGFEEPLREHQRWYHWQCAVAEARANGADDEAARKIADSATR